jgi:hypothetical protein
MSTASVIVEAELLGDLSDAQRSTVQDYSDEVVAGALFVSRHAIDKPEIDPEGAADRMDVKRIEQPGGNRKGSKVAGFHLGTSANKRSIVSTSSASVCVRFRARFRIGRVKPSPAARRRSSNRA